MARYTVRLAEICEADGREAVEQLFKSYELADYLKPKEIEVIERAGVWNKDKLAKKIVDHYYLHEIGIVPVGAFRHYAKITMEEIMEEKLPLIYSQAIEYDPLINVDFKEIYSGTNNSKGKSESMSSANGLGINSDTPQGQVNKDEILAGKYATSTGANETEGRDNTNSQSEGSETYERHTIGNSGVSATAQKMVEQYRDNIRAIDREIIEELHSQLFMMVY